MRSRGYTSVRAAILHHPEAVLLGGVVIYIDKSFSVVFGAEADTLAQH